MDSKNIRVAHRKASIRSRYALPKKAPPPFSSSESVSSKLDWQRHSLQYTLVPCPCEHGRGFPDSSHRWPSLSSCLAVFNLSLPLPLLLGGNGTLKTDDLSSSEYGTRFPPPSEIGLVPRHHQQQPRQDQTQREQTFLSGKRIGTGPEKPLKSNKDQSLPDRADGGALPAD